MMKGMKTQTNSCKRQFRDTVCEYNSRKAGWIWWLVEEATLLCLGKQETQK